MIYTRVMEDEIRATGSEVEFDYSSAPNREMALKLSDLVDEYLVLARIMARFAKLRVLAEDLAASYESGASFDASDLEILEDYRLVPDADVLSLTYVRPKPLKTIPVNLHLSVGQFGKPRIEKEPETWQHELDE